MLLILQLQLWLTCCVTSLVAAGALVPAKPGVVSLRVHSSTALAIHVRNVSTAPFMAQPTHYNVYLFSPTSVGCDASAVSGGIYRRSLDPDVNTAAAVRSLFTTPVHGQSAGSSVSLTENVDSLDTCMALCVATGAACKAVEYHVSTFVHMSPYSKLDRTYGEKFCYQLDRTYDSLFVSMDDSVPRVDANKLTEANVKSFALLSSGAHCSSFTNLRVAGYWTDGGTIEQCYIAMMTYKDEVGVGCNGQTFQYHSGSGDCGCGKDTCVSQTSDVAWNVYRTYEEKVKCLYQISASGTGILLAPNSSVGVYTADVYACNDQGCSTGYATAFTSFPGSPKSVDLRVAGENSLSMNIEPPEDDGGANISHYEVTICPVIYGDNLINDGTFEEPDAGQAWKEHNSPTFAGIVDGFSRFNTRSYRVEAENKACGGEQVISVQLGDHLQISTWTKIESITGVATSGDWPAYVRVFDNSTGWSVDRPIRGEALISKSLNVWSRTINELVVKNGAVGLDDSCTYSEDPCVCLLRCPAGQVRYGDGSACTGGGLPDCDLGYCLNSPTTGRSSCVPSSTLMFGVGLYGRSSSTGLNGGTIRILFDDVRVGRRDPSECVVLQVDTISTKTLINVGNASTKEFVADVKSFNSLGSRGRSCTVFEKLWKTGGAHLPAAGGHLYGARLTWDQCLSACRSTDECLQTIWNGFTCYPMTGVTVKSFGR